MKVLLINGSPNEKGCTYTALSEVAATLNENGVETEIASIGKQPIRGCIGCGGGAGKRRCVFGDDIVNSMIEKMEQADGLIIGSPVYFASPNGNLMSMLDRFFYAGGCFAHKPAAAVASSNTSYCARNSSSSAGCNCPRSIMRLNGVCGSTLRA